MRKIENLIYTSYNRINSETTKLSDNFRNDILKSLLDINNQYTDSQELTEFILQQGNQKDIKQTKADYIKLLKNLSLINELEEKS